MLNDVQLMGRLTSDPQFFSSENYRVARFTLAVQRDYKDENGDYPADFIRIVAWGVLADFVASYFTKGQRAAVKGSLRTRPYTDKNGNKRTVTEIVADNVYFAGSKADSENTVYAYKNETPEEMGLRNTDEYKNLVEKLEADDDYPF